MTDFITALNKISYFQIADRCDCYDYDGNVLVITTTEDLSDEVINELIAAGAFFLRFSEYPIVPLALYPSTEYYQFRPYSREAGLKMIAFFGISNDDYAYAVIRSQPFRLSADPSELDHLGYVLSFCTTHKSRRIPVLLSTPIEMRDKLKEVVPRKPTRIGKMYKVVRGFPNRMANFLIPMSVRHVTVS